MKLLITVQGVQYEVDVQVLDEGGVPAPSAPAAPSAAPSAPTPPSPPPQAQAPQPEAAPSSVPSTGEEVKSPIAGSILDIKVKPGDTVQANDPLLVLEAMKMESVVYAPQAGTVSEVLVSTGDGVQADQVLIRL